MPPSPPTSGPAKSIHESTAKLIGGESVDVADYSSCEHGNTAQPPHVRRSHGVADASLMLTAMLEEYRQLYGLAIFRLQALDQRLSLAGAGLLAILASIVVLPPHALWVMLAAAPAALPWLLRSTMRHAGSFQDALDRIALIERAVNQHVGTPAMTFQSTHPSRGKTIGGRTGHEAIEAIQGAAAIVLGGCLYLSAFTAPTSPWVLVAYSFTIAALAGGLIATATLATRRIASGDAPRT